MTPEHDDNPAMFKHDLGDNAELRILEMRHATEFLEFIQANREHLSVWLGWGETINTLEDAQHFIKRGVTRYAEDGLPMIGIWQENTMVGGLLFFPLSRSIKGTEIGYWLGQTATGRGLMTRAVRAVLSFAFNDLKLNRVGLHADVRNTPSRALAERLGFTLEGIERQSWLLHGQLTDNAAYSMLADEWKTQQHV
jgi:ribosomal-protein-serine acetyltransferase